MAPVINATEMSAAPLAIARGIAALGAIVRPIIAAPADREDIARAIIAALPPIA